MRDDQKMKAGTMHICRLSARLTVGDLRDFVSEYGGFVVTNSAPIYATISGHGSDPRDLWEIPEVASLCRRAIESGLISLMIPNIGAERTAELLGAWDVWALATGKLVDGVSELTPTVLDEFNTMLSAANERADVVIAKGPSGREKAWYLTDGPALTVRYWFREPTS